jgi:hypothetical protein
MQSNRLHAYVARKFSCRLHSSLLIAQNQFTRATPSPQAPPLQCLSSRPVSPPPHIVGQIMEMGFSPQQARIARAATDTGLDVQAALETLFANGAGNSSTPPCRVTTKFGRPHVQMVFTHYIQKLIAYVLCHTMLSLNTVDLHHSVKLILSTFVPCRERSLDSVPVEEVHDSLQLTTPEL